MGGGVSVLAMARFLALFGFEPRASRKLAGTPEVNFAGNGRSTEIAIALCIGILQLIRCACY